MNTPLNSIQFKGVHFVASSVNTIDPEGFPISQDEWVALHEGLRGLNRLTRNTADQFATTFQVSTEPFVYDIGKKRVFVVLTEKLAELAKSFNKMRADLVESLAERHQVTTPIRSAEIQEADALTASLKQSILVAPIQAELSKQGVTI